MLQAAGQYRETKASLYRCVEDTATEPEFVPWTGDFTDLDLRFEPPPHQ